MVKRLDAKVERHWKHIQLISVEQHRGTEREYFIPTVLFGSGTVRQPDVACGVSHAIYSVR